MDTTDLAWNVKRSKHIIMRFEAKFSKELAAHTLDWINSQSTVRHRPDALSAQLDLFERRSEGALTPRALAATHRLSPLLMSNPAVFVKHSGYLQFEVGALDLAIDVFRPDLDLGIQGQGTGMCLELFLVGARGHDAGTAMGEIAERAVNELVVDYLFGGGSSYLTGYLATFRGTEGPQFEEFLWPVIFSPRIAQTAAVLDALPCYRMRRLSRGTFVQVFQDLETGNQMDYNAAVQMLGMRGLDEFKLE